MTEAWQRRALYLAGAWNIIGGAGALADPARHFAQFYTTALSLDDPLQAFFFRTTWINAMAWGIAYTMAGRYRTTRLPVLAAGGAGKVAYCGACVGLFLTGVGNMWLLATGVADVLFAVLFAYVLRQQRPVNGPSD
jgi:ABC-type Mn2+/Zn2+ transport system permease subunit